MSKKVILIGAALCLAAGFFFVGGTGATVLYLMSRNKSSQEKEADDNHVASNANQEGKGKALSADEQQLSERIQLVIAIHRHMAALQEISFWSGKDIGGVPKDMIERERELYRLWNEQQRQLKLKWGNKSKSIAEINPRKSKLVNDLAEATRTIVRETLEISHKQMRLEHQAAQAKLRADVFLSRPLPPSKLPNRFIVGESAYQDEKLLQDANDNLFRAEREVEIARRWEKLHLEIADKWIRKAQDDNQKSVAALVASFTEK
jgi:hypothetical protein